MKYITMFLVVLCFQQVALAVPSMPRVSPTDEKSYVGPKDAYKPGILPCPDESRMTKENDLAKLENHSRDCGPATGAIKTQPDRPDGEVRDSDVPAEFK